MNSASSLEICGKCATIRHISPVPVDPSLTGLMWSLPGTADAGMGSVFCDATSTDSATFTGSGATRFSVSARVRGVVEMKRYNGGLAKGRLNINGTPDTDPDYMPLANVYKLEVSNPANTYYINRDDGVALPAGSRVAALDFTFTFQVQGGATLTLSADSIEGGESSNPGNVDGSVPFRVSAADDDPDHPIRVAQPFSPPFYGQFAQLDILKIWPIS